MVKGISRQVILVTSPEEPFLEQAIFLVKEDALAQEAPSPEQLLAQISQLNHTESKNWSISNSIQSLRPPKNNPLTAQIPWGLWVLLGASGSSVLWGLYVLSLF